ncbi:hypothetical protein K8354_16635 [Polaribacter litorisediminis]|uniref:hypothetical protein n=1 Tax=Polaribacter litorisediminis TaxID=1908341 RepID=UPI001CC055BD|nr:hypothetical protein [Polaribacter litorisediminis]UAM97893.1 hypothetical protein K8354_16635 [Polaribacter litorisediminis]
MKKVILSLVFVLATGTMMNANTSNEEIATPTTETIEVVEDFGCRGECNADARAGALAFATDHEDRSSEGELYGLWELFYTTCVDARGC